jgi:hypothetical protein
MSTKALSGAKMPRFSAALLLIRGSVLRVLARSLGMAALAIGFAAVHLGQLCASTKSDGRLSAFALSGALSLIGPAVLVLSGAGFDGDRS